MQPNTPQPGRRGLPAQQHSPGGASTDAPGHVHGEGCIYTYPDCDMEPPTTEELVYFPDEVFALSPIERRIVKGHVKP